MTTEIENLRACLASAESYLSRIVEDLAQRGSDRLPTTNEDDVCATLSYRHASALGSNLLRIADLVPDVLRAAEALEPPDLSDFTSNIVSVTR